MSKKQEPKTHAVQFGVLAVKSIGDCKWNGSREADADLVSSVKALGVLEPIGVRETSASKYTLVFGARRLDAARQAKCDTIPAMIYPSSISDEEAQSMTLAENLPRLEQDPFQEAGIIALMKKKGLTDKEIAVRGGFTEKFVRRRLKLADLDAEVAKAIDWNVVKIECLELLATLPKDQQRSIADTQPHMLSEIEELNFEILGVGDLSEGKFDVTDATLVPKAGACTDCPKRTGAEKLLFEGKDYKNDHCLDGACFRIKCDAALGNSIGKLRAKNPTAICVYNEFDRDFENETLFKLHDAKPVNGRDLEFCKKDSKGARVAIDLSRGLPTKVCYVCAPDKSGSTDKRQNKPTTPEDKVQMLGKRRLAFVAEKVRGEIQRAEAFADKYENWEALAKIAAAFGGYSPKTVAFSKQTIAEVGLSILNATQRNLQTLAQVYSVTEIDQGELDKTLTAILDLLTGDGPGAMKAMLAEAEQEIPMPKTLAKELEKAK